MRHVVHIPWYATLLRADAFEEALAEIAPLALRYGASDYFVHRSREDGYKFLQMAGFEDKADFARYWDGPEFIRWRQVHGSWYQVPVLYALQQVTVEGALEYGEAAAATPAGGAPDPPAAA